MSIVQTLIGRVLAVVQDPQVQARVHVAVVTSSTQTLAAIAAEAAERAEEHRATVETLKQEVAQLEAVIEHRRRVGAELATEIARLTSDRTSLRSELAQLAEQHRAHASAPRRAGDLLAAAVEEQRRRAETAPERTGYEPDVAGDVDLEDRAAGDVALERPVDDVGLENLEEEPAAAGG